MNRLEKALADVEINNTELHYIGNAIGYVADKANINPANIRSYVAAKYKVNSLVHIKVKDLPDVLEFVYQLPDKLNK